MTLIAAFSVGGASIVLGDMMLSTVHGPSGRRKKVHRIAPNLAVAWTGHLIAAESVIGAAWSHFQQVTPTVSSLESFFKDIAPTDFGADVFVEILGWIVQGSNRFCFRWRTDWPQEVFYAGYQCGGSGEKLIEQAARVELTHQGMSAEAIAVFLMTRMMGDEGGDQANWRKGFGFAYEALLWQGDEFRHINNILYGFCDAPFDAAGHFMGVEFVSTIVKYDCLHEQYAVVQRQSIVTVGGVFRTHTDRHLIGPVYRLPDRDAVIRTFASPDYSFEYDAKYTGLYAAIIKDADTPHRTVLPLPAVVVTSEPGSAPGFSVSFNRPDPDRPNIGTLEVRIPDGVFEVAYKDQVGLGESSPPATGGS